jgi:DNA-binding CsgD family transcriptional regulator
VDGLASGRPFVLTTRGQPGSGRSALLAAARQAAADAGVRSLAARGVDDRSAFAGLAALLRPLEPELDVLAGEQASALRSVTRSAGATVDADDVGAGVLRALTAASATSPLLLVLDDADRLDAATVDALVFVFARLGVEPIGAVAATGAAPSPFDGMATEVLPLAPLTRRTLAEIAARTAPCSEAVAGKIGEWADGSPLLAVELARSLSDDERNGSVPLPEAPRPTVLLVERLQAELSGLPDDVQRALVVVAADRTGDVAAVLGALRALAEPADALDRAEAAGIVHVSGGSVRFRHALLRPLSYRLVAAASRRAAHRALATVLTEPHQAAERAWQLVASTAGPDEDAAEALEAMAVAEHRRGNVVAAASAWDEAARLSVDATARQRRQAAAVAAHHEANQRDGSGPVDALAAALSAAELRVAEAVASGLTNREAAARLFLSAKTVDFHLQSIYRKLAIRSRAELATRVATRGRA